MQATKVGVATVTGPRAGLVVVALAAAQLMLVLDVTVVNVALPDIGGSLGLGRGVLTWVMTIYTAVFGGLVLVGGKLADIFGARRVFIAGLVVFVLASLACALARDAAWLLTGRAFQGIGAALLSPAALAVLLATLDGSVRGRALAVWGSLSAAGAAVGVSLGGLITSTVGWPWIFAINVPIGVVILIAVPRLTTPVASSGTGRPDLTGAVLVTAGTVAMVYGLVNAGHDGWATATTVVPLVAGVASWFAFVVVEQRIEDPMLRPALLREAPVAAGALLMVVATALMVGNFFLGSFVLQRAYGDGPLRVGLEFLPVAGAVALGARLAGSLLRRATARAVGSAGLVLAAAGEVIAAVSGGRAWFVVGLAVAALGIGAVFVTAFTVALISVGADDGGLRSAIVSTAHELGGAFGVAILSTVAAAALTTDRPDPAAFSGAFWFAAAAAAGAALAAILLVPAAARSASNGQPHQVRS